MLHPILSGSHSLEPAEFTDHVAAIRKACFLADVVQIPVREAEIVFHPGQTDLLDILLAGDAIQLFEPARKGIIAHTAVLCDLLHTDGFTETVFNIVGHRIHLSDNGGSVSMLTDLKTILHPGP